MATMGAVGDGPSVAPVIPLQDSSGSFHVADAETLFLGDYSRHGHDLVIEHNGASVLVENYFDGAGGNLVGPNGAFLTPSVVHALAGPNAPGQYAQEGAPTAAALSEIGKVVSIEGTATITHSDGVTVNLANGDPVYQGDVVSTGAGSKLGISFIDDSVFSMSADARMVLNELIFDPAKVADSSMVVNLVQGSFVFVTGQVAPSGSMKVETPVATMGIRGTTPKVSVSTELGVTEFSILPDPGSGKVGSYVLIDKTTGAILGTVESVGDKWVITTLSDEAVKVAKSGLDLLEDEAAISDIRDAVSNALGQRTQLNGANSFQQVAFDASASSTGQDGGQSTDNGGNGQSGGDGGTDPTPDKDDPPIAGDDAFSTNEDAVLVGGNVINASGGGADVDPDGFALAVTAVNGQTLNFVGDTASVLLPANAVQQTVGANLLISKTGGITYDPSAAFNYLAVGETRIESFTYTVTDKNGFTDTATVNITVTGRNDAPDITSGPVASTINESSEVGGVGGGFSGGPVSGQLSFNDVDISDTGHTYQVVSVVETRLGGAPANPLGGNGLLALLNTNGSFDDGASLTGGTLKWNFTGSEDQFDYLAAGESVRLTYTVQVTDPYGATDTQTITITVIGAADDGSNDEPVISVESGDAAFVGLTETNAGLTTNGKLTVTEVDLTDVVQISVVSVGASGTTLGLGPDNAALKAMLSLSSATILTDSVATAEKFTWTFNSQNEAFNYLDDGETLTLAYVVRATDNRAASDDQTVTITITGTNDVPVITVGAGDSAAETLTETNAGLTISDTLTVVDLDLSDAVTASVQGVVASGTTTGLGPDNTALLAMLSVTAGTIAADTGSAANLGWTFNSGSEAFNYLDDGESLTLTYTVRATDDSNTHDDQTVTITITGTNDVPVITVGAGDSAAETLTETNAGLTISDTLTVVDLDLSDAVTASVQGVVASGTTTGLGPDNTALLAMLSVTAGTIAADTGSAANLGWTFNSGSEAFNYLAAGESLTLTYTVRATDDSATHDDQTVTITITGTNDDPVVAAADVTGGVTELTAADTPVALLTDTGTIGFTDVDLTDTHSIDPTITPSAGALGTLIASVTTDTTAGLGGEITWNYSVDPALVEYLADGETKDETFTITLDDGNGGTVERTITVTITGTNDDPVLSGVNQVTVDFDEIASAGSGVHIVGNEHVADGFKFAGFQSNGTPVGLGTMGSSSAPGLYPGSASLLNPYSNGYTEFSREDGSPFKLVSIDLSESNGSQLTGSFTITGTTSTGDTVVQTVTKDGTFGFQTVQLTGFDDLVSVRIDGSSGQGYQIDNIVAEFIDPQSGVLAELTDGNTVENDYSHSTSGTVAFSDVDTSDSHTVSSDPDLDNPTDLPSASFTLTNPGTVDADGNIGWKFTVDDADLDFLAEGETREFTYTVTIDDGNGGTDTKDVVVTVTGTNDAPVAVADTGTDEPPPLPSGLIAQWSADGTTEDAVGDNDGGVLHNGATYAPGKFGQAFSFDGVDDYFSAPSTGLPTGNEDRTLSLWMTGSEFVNFQSFLAGYGDFSTTQAYVLGTTGAAPFFSQWGQSVNGTPLQTDHWYHVAVTNVGDDVTLYVDGVAVATGTLSINTPLGTNFIAGGSSAGALHGEVDDIRVYDHALTAEEVQSLYDAGSLPTGNVLDNDTDVDHGDSLSVVGVAAGAPAGDVSDQVGSAVAGTYGALTLGADGTWTYARNDNDPDTQQLGQGQAAEDVFTYTLADAHGATSTTSLTITIHGINDAPVIAEGSSNLSGAVTENDQATALTGQVVFSDVDHGATVEATTDTGEAVLVYTPDGSSTPEPLPGGLDAAAIAAALTLNPDGSWSYDASALDLEALGEDDTITVTYSVTVTDEHGATDTAPIVITLTGTNDAPVVTSETYEDVAGLNGQEDSPLVISAADLLDNDTDVDGDTLTITGVSLFDEPDGFTIELDDKDNSDPLDDEIIITPAANFSGLVNFEYTVSDGTEAVAGEATANFVPVADAPLLSVSAWGSGDGTPVAATSEFRVNTDTDNLQNQVAVAALADGGSIVVWASFTSDLSGSKVYGQRLDANGDQLDSQFQVNATTGDLQRYPAVAALGDAGGFIVVWTSLAPNGSGNFTNENVYGQVYGADGTPTGTEFQITASAAGETVTELSDGNFLITWTPNDGNEVYGRIYSSAGVAPDPAFAINSTTTGLQNGTNAAAFEDGGFVVLWNHEGAGGDGDGYAIFGRLFDANGVAVDVQFQVNQTTTDHQLYADVTVLNDGNFVVAWQSGGGSGVDIYARLYSADGTALTDEFLVNTENVSDQSNPAVIDLDDGGFLVTWTSQNQDAAGGSGFYGQRFDANGDAVGQEFLINETTTGNQTASGQNGGNVDQLENGNIAFVWYGNGDGDSAGIFSRIFELNSDRYVNAGEPINLSITASLVDTDNSESLSVILTGLPEDFEVTDGVAQPLVSTGTADAIDLAGLDLSALVISAPPNFDEVVTLVVTATSTEGANLDAASTSRTLIFGSSQGDTLTGTEGDDLIFGGDGGDSVLGDFGADQLFGGNGDDTLEGGAGDDYMAGGEGADIYIGGGDGNSDEYDGISFRDETGGGGVYVDLSGGPGNVQDTYGNIETATGIEEVDGSRYDDTLIGNAADNYFSGREGADSYDGGVGGFDQVTFDDEASELGNEHGAEVNLALGTGTDTYGNTETFTSIEVLRGSQWADSFTGDANANTFRGLAGDDHIDGGDGWDQVRYDRDANKGGTSGVTVNLVLGTATDGFGDHDTLSNIESVRGTQVADTLIGDNGDNELLGLDGNDLLIGGGGSDWMRGAEGNDRIDGGSGDDNLGGGSGADTFILAPGAGQDQIQDFNVADGDLIDLQAYGFTSTEDFAGMTYDSGGAYTYIDFNGVDGVTIYGIDLTDPVEFPDPDVAFIFTGGPNLVQGTPDDDQLFGTSANDLILPLDTSYQGTDDIFASLGNDVFDFAGAGPNGGFYSLNYWVLDAYTDLTVNIGEFGGTIEKGEAGAYGTDTLINIAEINGMDGGLGISTVYGGIADITVDLTGIEYFDLSVSGGGSADMLEVSGTGYTNVVFYWGYEGVEVHVGAGMASASEIGGEGSELAVTGFVNQWRGTAGYDFFEGGDGNETFIGFGGSDLIDGGDGRDEVRYDRDANFEGGQNPVTVNLATGTATDGFGDTDTLIDIEDVRGSQFGDSLTGNDIGNNLRGLGGADTLFGGDGDDQLFGGDGSDQLTGGDGADEFILYAGETGVDEILDFETDNDLISLFGYDENTTTISLADNGAGGSDLVVNSQVVATLDNISYDTDLNIHYDVDHHVITMMAVV